MKFIYSHNRLHNFNGVKLLGTSRLVRCFSHVYMKIDLPLTVTEEKELPEVQNTIIPVKSRETTLLFCE